MVRRSTQLHLEEFKQRSETGISPTGWATTAQVRLGPLLPSLHSPWPFRIRRDAEASLLSLQKDEKLDSLYGFDLLNMSKLFETAIDGNLYVEIWPLKWRHYEAGPLGRGQGSALMNAIHTLIHKTQRFSSPFHHVSTQGQESHLTTRNPSSESLGTWILGLPASRNVREKFLLFISCLVYGILLEKPEWTKAIIKCLPEQFKALFSSKKSLSNIFNLFPILISLSTLRMCMSSLDL